MIRSSRIPPLLDKICTDGIVSSLLISKDGELLGSSTINAAEAAMATTTSTPKIAVTGISHNETTFPKSTPGGQGAIEDGHNMITIGSSSAASSSPTLPSWVNMNPSDIGALIAEVVEDYKQLGYELSLLDPSFYSSPSPATMNVGGGSSSSGGGGPTGGGGGSTDPTKNITAGNNDGGGKGGDTSRQQDKQQEEGTKNNVISKVTGGNDTSAIKETNGHKDRGRLNCLIMELDLGIIGITSATSSTYVIALAESTTQHGLLKDRLTVLATLFQDNLEMVSYT